MNVFENKSIIRKTAIVILIIVVASFLFSGNVNAKSSDNGIGGKLLKPVISLVLSLGDGFYDIVHKVIFNQDVTLLHIDLTTGFFENLWKTISTIGIFVLAAVTAAVVVIATAGLAAGLVAALTGVTLGSLGVGTVLLVSAVTGTIAVSVYNSTYYPDDEIVLPLYSISPEEIFSNEIVIFDVDFFNSEKTKILKDEEGKDIIGDDGNPIELESTARKLKSVVANWYVVLRDISLVALLSVLVYIGIKILISSTSGDKAKYKEMLKDWIVAICLLFVMQYIMSFSNLIVEKVTDIVKGINVSNGSLELIADKDGKVSKGLKDNYGYTDAQLESLYAKTESNEYMKDEDGDKYIYWHTDLIGRARLSAQMGQQYSSTYAGYTIIFLILIVFTISFIFTYLKRIIYMAFLTIIAPLVALTYPIDKINDGKAQAFDMWFKEYIFNLLIQPMHLILYTVLISSAFELASSNILYSLVALGFMVPAEKLLRKFFGFEKAQTPGLLAGPTGAAIMMSGMNKLLSGGKGKANKSSGSKLTSSSAENGKTNIKYKDFDEESMLGTKNLGAENVFDNKDDINATKNFGGISTDNKNGMLPENQYIEDKIKNRLDNAKSLIGDKAKDLKTSFDYTPMGQALSYRKLSATNGMRKLKNKSRLVNAASEATKYYARGMQNKIRNKVKNGELGKKAIRTAGGVALGGVAATAGLAMGVASGDPSKAAQYAFTGALGGYKTGGTVIDDLGDTLGVAGTVETANRAYYGDEQYEEKQRQKYIKEKQNDFDFQNRMIKAMNGDEKKAKQVINDVFPTCAEYGFVEPEEVSAIHNMVDKEGYDTKEALAWAQKAKKYGKDTNSLSAKDDKEYNETLKNNYIKKGFSEKQSDDMAKTVRRGVDKYNKYLYKAKK